jgi:hypothetical protein
MVCIGLGHFIQPQVWVDIKRLTIELDTRSQLDISSDCLLSLSILAVDDGGSVCGMPTTGGVK